MFNITYFLIKMIQCVKKLHDFVKCCNIFVIFGTNAQTYLVCLWLNFCGKIFSHYRDINVFLRGEGGVFVALPLRKL